jgi:predicted TIM-barrel fold metal-dependent hydrolase
MEPPDLWERYLDVRFRDRAPQRLMEYAWDVRIRLEGSVLPWTPERESITDQWPTLVESERTAVQYREEMTGGFDAKAQVRAMEKEGLDLAVLYPTVALYICAFPAMDAAFGTALCRAYNNWLADFIHQADPQRIRGAAAICPHDVTLAVAETQRAVAELGMRAIFLRPNIVNNRPWHDPYYDPLWATCQDVNIPVGFHEGTCLVAHSAGAERFRNFGTAHIASHPLEQMLACRDVIMGGVLERFPRLRVAFLEANCGWLPWWLERMDGHFEWRRKYGELQHLRLLPSEYFRRQCFVSVECDEKLTRFVVEELGDDCFVTSTDYPHADAKYPHAMDHFLQLDLQADSRRKIVWDNTQRLYAL